MKKLLPFLPLMLTGCFGMKLGGKVEHRVVTEGTTEVVLKIDISGCMEMESDQMKMECIKAMTETFADISETYRTIVCYKENEENPEVCLPPEEVIKLFE